MNWVTSWRVGLTLQTWMCWLAAWSHTLTTWYLKEWRAVGRFWEDLRGTTLLSCTIMQGPQTLSSIQPAWSCVKGETRIHRTYQILGNGSWPCSSPSFPFLQIPCPSSTISSSELPSVPGEEGLSADLSKELSTWRGCTVKSYYNDQPAFQLSWFVCHAVFDEL